MHPFTCQSFNPFMCPSIHQSIYLAICRCIHSPINHSTHPSIHPSIHVSVGASIRYIHQPIIPPIHLSNHRSVYQCTSPSHPRMRHLYLPITAMLSYQRCTCRGRRSRNSPGCRRTRHCSTRCRSAALCSLRPPNSQRSARSLQREHKTSCHACTLHSLRPPNRSLQR